MSTTEALRTQLDNLRLANQQLQVKNARLREENPDEAALIDAIAERDRLEEEKRNLTAENQQFQALYEQLLQDSQEEQKQLEELKLEKENLQQETVRLQQEKEEKESCLEEMRAHCTELEKEIADSSLAAELECYRAVEREKVKWKERKARWLHQLREMEERQLKGAGGKEQQSQPDDLSLSEYEDVSVLELGEAARTRVTSYSVPSVSEFYPLTPTTTNTQVGWPTCTQTNGDLNRSEATPREVPIPTACSGPDGMTIPRAWGVVGKSCPQVHYKL